MLGSYGVEAGDDQLRSNEQTGGQHEVAGDGNPQQLGGDGGAQVRLVAQHEVGLERADHVGHRRRHPACAAIGEVVRELHLGGAGGHHLQWRATLARRDRVVVRPRAGREGGEPGFLDLRDQTAGPCDRDVVAGLTSGACEREQGRQVTETSDERDEQAHGVAA